MKWQVEKQTVVRIVVFVVLGSLNNCHVILDLKLALTRLIVVLNSSHN